MAWDFRRYGSASDPIHKSHLNDITGDYGCPTRFRYQMDARAEAEALDLERPVRGDAACGTAAHETIARALTSDTARPRILAGEAPHRDTVRRAFFQGFERECGGRRVEWYDKDGDTMIDDRVDMIVGLLGNLHRYVAEVVLVEPAFVVKLGAYWMSGHVDLVYRPRRNPDAIAIADWKTGATRPAQVELDHSWEAGIYSVAVHDGWFLDRAQLEACSRVDGVPGWEVRCGSYAAGHPSRYIAERECAELVLSAFARAVDDSQSCTFEVPLQRLERFPAEIYHVHLADYVPYKRAGKKEVKRPEDLAFYGRTAPGPVKFEAGALRGPAWLSVRLGQHDIPRVEYRVRNVVGMIRMGRFIDQIGDRCTRCPYAGDCLNGGYAVRGDERKALERALTPDDASSADELAID